MQVVKKEKMANLVKEVEMESKVQIVLGLNLVTAPTNISIMETILFTMVVPLLLKEGLGVSKTKNILEFQKNLGTISHRKSLITIFVHKHKIKKFKRLPFWFIFDIKLRILNQKYIKNDYEF